MTDLEKFRYYGFILERNHILNHLISIIDAENDQNARLKYLTLSSKKKIDSKIFFEFLEDLVISDLNKEIRTIALRILIRDFLNQSYFLIEWIIQPGNQTSIIFSVITSLSKYEPKYLKSLLLKNLEKNIWIKSQINNVEIYNKELRSYFSQYSLVDFTHDKLVNLYLNYSFIFNLEKTYKLFEHPDTSTLSFNLEEGLIKELRIWGLKLEKISDLDGINRIESLKILDLSGNSLREIDALENLQDLELLKFGDLCYDLGNNISEIKGLDMLRNLKILNISNNEIKKIEGLDNLLQLKRLYIVNNKLTEINGLNTLSELQYLNLERNQISYIQNLNNLKKLELLDLGNNRITILNNLEELPKLKELRIYNNNISEVGFLPDKIIIKIHQDDPQQNCFLDKIDIKLLFLKEFEKPKEYDSRYLQ